MRFNLSLVFIVFFSFWTNAAFAAIPEVEYGPTPAWTVPVEAAKLTDEMVEESGGSIYLLIDTQVSSDQRTERYYYRKVVKTTNITGVEDVSDINITFDPAFHRLILHHLKVIRDGREIDQTKNAAIDMARLERDLDRRIYNGEWTALVRLSDVRPGDIVDAAWSWEGRNPVFGEQDFGNFTLAWSVPVAKRHLRVDWPTEMIKRWQAVDAPVEPKIEAFGPRTVFTFGPYAAEAVKPELGAPGWVRQYPTMDISSFADWNEVSQWAVPLYKSALPASVQQVVDQIKIEHKTPQDQLLAALKFSQEEVRYLSIAIGKGGYIPRDPDVTLQKRFGDCKDKTMLFVSMARALGYDAVPALADLDTGHGLADLLPSPGAFDHVIAKVKVQDKTYWFDATAKGQRGPLADFEQAEYGYALPISTQTTALAPMDERDNDHVTERIVETIDISKGPDQPLLLSSTSEFRGPMANSMRSRLANHGRIGVQKSYLQFYENYFPGIEYDGPMVIEDDVENNIIRLTEKLIAKDPYTLDKDSGLYVFNYTTYGVPNLIDTQATRPRKTPLAIASGVNTEHEITVLLTNKGKEWDLDEEHTSLDNSAFMFKWDAKKSRNKWTLKAKVRTKSIIAPAGDAQQILEDHSKIREDISWGLRIAPKE